MKKTRPKDATPKRVDLLSNMESLNNDKQSVTLAYWNGERIVNRKIGFEVGTTIYLGNFADNLKELVWIKRVSLNAFICSRYRWEFKGDCSKAIGGRKVSFSDERVNFHNDVIDLFDLSNLLEDLEMLSLSSFSVAAKAFKGIFLNSLEVGGSNKFFLTLPDDSITFPNY